MDYQKAWGVPRKYPRRSNIRTIPMILAVGIIMSAGCGRLARVGQNAGEVQGLTPEAAKKIVLSQSEDLLVEIPKISTHEHFKAGGDMEVFFEAMRFFNIEKVLFVPTGKSPDNKGCVENMAELLVLAKKYPDLIIPYAAVNETDAASPLALEEAYRGGARGLKLMSGHPNFYKMPLDNPVMMSLFAKARELNLPVLIHISPLKFPSQRKEFENLLRAFPEVRVVAAHYGRTAPEFAETRRLLDTYPNLFMDISMGGGLKRYRKEMRADVSGYTDFINKYQDRLMWGTDIILSKKTNLDFLRGRIGMDMLVLGKPFYADTRPGMDPEKIFVGLGLPSPVLRKIFYENPQKILAISAPEK